MEKKGEKYPHFRDKNWAYTYRTSSLREDGNPVDILHDFYFPVLERSMYYDRVAGYFTSSSLAAASQGYSAFTAQDGKMRLITGKDIDPLDVSAVLAGLEEAQLEKQLLSELDGCWPEDVTRGVELLAWMVSRKFLEIKIAARLHGKTHSPLPFESREDGYVHEKWALFKDRFGREILASGSLNESKTALMLNAENLTIDCDWWEGPSRSRIEDHKRDFELLWRNLNPHFEVRSVPDAVREKLVRMGERVRIPREIDGTPRKIPPKPTPEEWLAFKVIKMGPKMPGGLWVGMETAPVSPWPHQEVVARRLVENWPSSFLLCDEVGLGKTIEAGLALRSLLLSGVISRVLVAPPAGLAQQWHREMASKFFLPFQRGIASPKKRHEILFPDQQELPADNLFAPDLCILSTGLLPREERLSELKEAEPFDVVLLDEAQYARRKSPAVEDSCRSDPTYGKLYKVLQKNLKEKARALWLATATPVQLDWIEAFDLFRLSDRVGPFRDSPSLARAYYAALGKILREETLTDSEWKLLKRSMERSREEDPWLWKYLHDGMIRGHLKIVLKDWLEEDRTPRPADLHYVRQLLFALAPLSRVMLRHTRDLLRLYKEKGQLRANLAVRSILPIPKITFSTDERRVYEDLQTYCDELTRQIGIASPEDEGRVSLGFYLSFLRQRCSSSFFALKESLRRRKDKVERTLKNLEISENEKDFNPEEQDSDWDLLENVLENRNAEDLTWEQNHIAGMLDRLALMAGISSKTRVLLKELDERRSGGRIRQTVLFTRYLDTLNDLLKTLQRQDAHMRIGVYSGQYCAFYDELRDKLVSCSREDVKKRFLRGDVDILLCTDAAAEGLNLQTADLLINYDLPWNPMKVEQRVGRIDRIGQKHENIYVLNLCMLDSVEEVIYGRLLSRFNAARNLVGSIPFSMLPLDEADFDAFSSGKMDIGELQILAEERMERQKRQIETLEMPTEEMYSFYQRLTEQNVLETRPVTLESIWEVLMNCVYLKDLGCATLSETDGKVLRLSGISGIPDGCCLTCDRELFETGVPGLDSSLHLATYLDPVFERVVEAVLEAAEIPLSVKILELKAYRPVEALLVRTGEEERLVTGLQDIQGVILSEEAPRKERFSEMEKEISTRLKEAEGRVGGYDQTIHSRVMKINEKAARTEKWLEWFCAFSYLDTLKNVSIKEEASFWGTLPDIERLIHEREEVSLSNVKTQLLRENLQEAFFVLNIPELGSTGTVSIPGILCRAAVDAACREAEALQKDYRKTDITIQLVKERLKRQMERPGVYEEH